MTSVAATFVVPVLAQDTLKITVTGTRSERAVEDIPGSISVIDLEDLRDQGSTDIKSITRYEPGISVFDPRNVNYGGSTSTGNLNIRGMRQNRILFIQDNIRLSLPGTHNVSNCIAADSIGHYLGLSMKDILNSKVKFP